MTQASEILKLIEKVDPEDDDAMDEIDIAVLKYLHERDWVHFTTEIDGKVLADAPSMFTSSRDALKSIRPEGWHYYGGRDGDGYYVEMNREDEEMDSGRLPTEELAELHAIIQAIEHERQNVV